MAKCISLSLRVKSCFASQSWDNLLGEGEEWFY